MPEERPVAVRDRVQTRHKIIEAVGRILARQGFSGLGINAIAREAGVDKVLIYRYFGGIDELLKAFAAESGFWPETEELLGEEPHALSTADLACRALLRYTRWMRAHPFTLEIMRWELQADNGLTRALVQHREEFIRRVFESFPDRPGIDLPAFSSILTGGITYMALRSHCAEPFYGLRLDSQDDWDRIEAALDRLARAAFAAAS
jgi:AcrR family transcriptional regulator